MLTQVNALLEELVAIDSTSARSNLKVVELLEKRLDAAGFTSRRHRYTDQSGVEKVNLVAQKGEGTPQLALVGHTDCVPFDPAWAEALQLTERDGRWYGRGACDTKAFVACAVVAAERARPEKALALVFTADEEVGCVGAKRLEVARALTARHAIVGEPTSLRPIRANKGYWLAEVEVRGVEGHSAYPDSGRSAIFRAARFIAKVEALSLTALRARQNPAFAPPFTTVNVGLVSGGRAKNIIPGSCRFTVEWRPVPGEPPRLVPGLLDGLVAELKAEDPTFDCTIEVTRDDDGFDTPENAEVVQFIARATGKPPETVAFGTEAPMLNALGAQSVVFGPGDISVAHRTGEHVPIAEVEVCAEVLARAIAEFCG